MERTDGSWPQGVGPFTLRLIDDRQAIFPGSTMLWNGSPGLTTPVEGSLYVAEAQVAAADVASPGTVQIALEDPFGAVSASLPLTIHSIAVGPVSPAVAWADGVAVAEGRKPPSCGCGEAAAPPAAQGLHVAF